MFDGPFGLRKYIVENKAVNKYVNRLNKEKTWANDKLNLDSHYVFNKKYYKQHKEIFADLNPTFIMQFGIILPFDLPFETKEYSIGKIMVNKNKMFITFIFASLKEKANLYFGFKAGKEVKYSKSRTRCEISISLHEPLIEIDEISCNIKESMENVKKTKKGIISQDLFFDSVKKVFSVVDKFQSIALHELNCMILSYSMINDDSSVHSISTDDIEFVSHFRGIDILTWETYNWMKLNSIGMFPEEKKAVIESEKFAQCLAIAHEYSNNQFSNYQAHLQDAKYLFSQGNLRAAVVQLNTATEVLLDSIVTLFWENEQKLTIEESHKKLEDTPFTKIVKTIIPQIIGGSWDITANSTIVNKWYNEGYNLRNRIVHGGYFPEKHEAYTSITSTFKLHDYIIELMCKSKFEYLQNIRKIPRVKIINMN